MCLKNLYDDTFYACCHEQRDVVYLVDMGQICHFYEKNATTFINYVFNFLVMFINYIVFK